MARSGIETKRLILRAPLKKDISLIVKYLSNPLVSETTLHIPYPYSKSDATDWLNQSREARKNFTAITFAIVMKKTNQMIGAIGLHPNQEHNRAEAGYWIAVPYWNKGLATEALIRILDFGFTQLGFNKIFATHLLDNPASGRVMSKAGMIKEGKLREHYKKGDDYISVIQYSLTASEFQQLMQKKNKNVRR